MEEHGAKNFLINILTKEHLQVEKIEMSGREIEKNAWIQKPFCTYEFKAKHSQLKILLGAFGWGALSSLIKMP